MACNDCEKAAEMLPLVLDEEVSKEELHEFELHLSNCTKCTDKYEAEKNLLNTIKSKISSNKCCPEDLLSSVKEKIKKLSDK